MRILLLSPLPPPAGGIATWTELYCEHLKKWDHDVEIVNTALVGGRKTRQRTMRLSDEWSRTWRICWGMHKCLRKEHFDVVHINSSCSRFGILRDTLCLLLAGKRNTVLHCHCNVEDQIGSGRFAGRVFSYAVKQAAAVIVLNGKSFDYVRKLDPKAIYLIPNFIEEDVLVNHHIIRERMEKILYVGAVRRRKGSAKLFAAATKLPELTFCLVGRVFEDMKNEPVPDNVKLLGMKPKEEVLQIMQDADMFLFPSYTEGFSNALLEAMACGLPVIATDVGANADMLEGKGGMIVPAGDCGAILEAMKQMEDDHLRGEMSAWNLQKVRTHYSADVIMKRLVDVYREVNP